MARNRKLILLIIFLIAVFLAKEIVYQLFPIKYTEHILKYSTEYQIDPYLLAAIIKAESGFDKDAASNKGAVGLMQLTEPTAIWIAESSGNEEFSTDELYDPETSIKMGTWYLDNIRKEFGSTETILAAYNAGRGNVRKWIDKALISEDQEGYSDIPFEETKNYIEKVLINQKIYKLLYDLN